ncbi:MAG: MFS transporter, partial [Hafnia sp.]
MSTLDPASAKAITPPQLSRRRWVIILILLLAAVVNYLDRANLSI